MRNLRNSKGFTLIELMIVVVIIGILAAIAIPKFNQVSKSAKESEADGVLKQGFSLQETYLQKHDTYATDADLAQVGWDVAQTGKYYSDFAVKGNATNTFCIEATSRDVNVTITKKIDHTRTIATGAC